MNEFTGRIERQRLIVPCNNFKNRLDAVVGDEFIASAFMEKVNGHCAPYLILWKPEVCFPLFHNFLDEIPGLDEHNMLQSYLFGNAQPTRRDKSSRPCLEDATMRRLFELPFDASREQLRSCTAGALIRCFDDRIYVFKEQDRRAYKQVTRYCQSTVKSSES